MGLAEALPGPLVGSLLLLWLLKASDVGRAEANESGAWEEGEEREGFLGGDSQREHQPMHPTAWVLAVAAAAMMGSVLWGTTVWNLPGRARLSLLLSCPLLSEMRQIAQEWPTKESSEWGCEESGQKPMVAGAEPTLLTLLSTPGTSFSFSAACCSFRFRSWNMSWCRFRVCMIFCRLGPRVLSQDGHPQPPLCPTCCWPPGLRPPAPTC